MKKKKLLAIILSVLLVFMTSYSVFAAIPSYDSTKPHFEIESVAVEKGEEFDVNINIGNNPGFWAAKFSIKCDSALSFVTKDNEPDVAYADLTEVSFVSNLKNNVFTCLINSNNSSNITYNGTILTLRLKASEEAKIGKYKISFTNYSSTNFIDYDGKKVAFTFANSEVAVGTGYFFEAYQCSPKSTGSGILSTYNQTDLTPNGTLTAFEPTAEGDSVSFILPNIAAGTYKLNTYSRDYNTRGTFNIFVDDVLINKVSYAAEFMVNRREIGTFTISTDKNVIVTFSAVDVIGKMYMMYFELEKINGNISSTSKPVSTVEGTTYTTTTTTTSPTTTRTTTMMTTGPATLDTSTAISISDVSKTDNWVKGSYDLSTGVYVLSSVRICVSKLVKVTPGRVYKFSTGYSDTNIQFVIRNYNSKGTFVSSVGALSSGSTYSFGTNTAYITVGIYHVKDNVTNLLAMVTDKVIKPVITDVSTTEGTTETTTTTTTTITTIPTTLPTTTTLNTTTEKTTTSKVTGYEVNLDGVATNVAAGGIFTLPNVEDNVVAYVDNSGKYYACGENVPIHSNTKFTSIKLSLETLEQASMRLKPSEAAKNISGIRFYTEVDQELISTLRKNDFTVELGTLIAPKQYFGTRPTTDLEFGVDFGMGINYLSVPYNSEEYYTDSNFSGIVGSLNNIKDNHAMWDFVGRGYAKITFNGVEKIVYASGKNKLPVRSIGYIAFKAKNDVSVYENYNEDQKAIIDYYYAFYKKMGNDPYAEDVF